jgi:hypothetical protein
MDLACGVVVAPKSLLFYTTYDAGMCEHAAFLAADFASDARVAAPLTSGIIYLPRDR